jgi:hypothetical protein
MAKHLYEVCLLQGSGNPEFEYFLQNVMDLNAKEPDYGGIKNTCIISHHMDAETVHLLCSRNIKKKSGVTVTEITRETLSLPNGHHKIYRQLIGNYFLPNDDYPNIGDLGT